MAISLQVASAVRVTVRGTAYLPSPAIILEGTTAAAASAAAASASASAASSSASAAAASAASISLPIPAASGGTGITSYATGDLIYASGTTALSKLAAASAGNVLLAGAAPAWGKVDLTTAVSGALPVANGGTGRASHTAYAVICGGTTSTGAQQTIASVGTTGQVLTSNGAGALPTFQDPAGSSVLVLIQTQVASSSAQIDFTTGLNDTYDRYIIKLDGVKPATDDVAFMLRVGTGAGPTYQTTGYDGVLTRTRGGSTTATITNTTTYIPLTDVGGSGAGLGNATGEKATITVEFDNPEASDFCEFDVRGQYGLALGSSGNVTGGGRYNTTGAITALRFMMSSGNIASGRFTLYGIKKS